MKQSSFDWMALSLAVAASGFVIISSLSAQPANGTSTVAQAKQELNAAGVQTEHTGPCGAFQITNLAAQKLNAGILDKPSGNHCEWPAGSGHFYSVDTVIYRNGRAFDVLVASEEQNGPSWQEGPTLDPSRYRDPVVAAGPVPTPPAPTCPPADNAAVLAKLAQLETAINALAAKPPSTVTFPNYRTSIWGASVVLRPDK